MASKTKKQAKIAATFKRPAKVETRQPTQQVRQGDVFLMRTDRVSGEIEPMPRDPRGIVIAEGETSAHYHAVIGGDAKLSRFKDGRAEQMLEVTSDAELRVIGGGSGAVERHTPITITPGKYLVRIQRAWDSANVARQVQD